MASLELTSVSGLKGTVTVPGDKSISHRCIMFGSIAKGTTEIHHFLRADCLATIDCFRRLGIDIEEKEDSILVHGQGLYGLHAPDDHFRCRKQRNNNPAYFRQF